MKIYVVNCVSGYYEIRRKNKPSLSYISAIQDKEITKKIGKPQYIWEKELHKETEKGESK